MAIQVWNRCGGLDWSALPVMSELFGYDDPALLIEQLLAIRDWQQANPGAAHGHQ
jgi:hypothetical protein